MSGPSTWPERAAGVALRPEERRPLLLSMACLFFLLATNFVVRPLRDEMGIRGGVKQLPWLFLATLCGMLLANPLLGALAARLPRQRLVPLVYGFFVTNLLGLWGALQLLHGPGAARALFIWASVFNLLVVSLFWALLADLFGSAQGRRLFGLVGAGGTVGSMVGSGLASLLAPRMAPEHLLLVAAALLSAGALVAARLGAEPGPQEAPAARVPQPALEGLRALWRSPYLLGISLYLLLFTLSSTWVYMAQAKIIGAALSDPRARTALLARLDLSVNVLGLLLQVLCSGRLLSRLGTGPVLTILPALTLAGLMWLASAPTLAVVFIFQMVRRGVDYGVAKPAREVLFTVVPRDEKYAPKGLIDTFVYRGGDALGAWVVELLPASPATALLFVPLCLGWALLGLRMGRLGTVLRGDWGRC